VKLLLDTHVALWAVVNDSRLSAKARRMILDDDNDLIVSAASVWEIAIKYALGLKMADRPGGGAVPFDGTEAVRFFREAGFAMLPVTARHAAAVESLPPIHADPFDRMLVAQAFAEPLGLLTGDPKVLAYGGTTISI
jgi:PIN domain nuclease of toxin-antitoxin system